MFNNCLELQILHAVRQHNGGAITKAHLLQRLVKFCVSSMQLVVVYGTPARKKTKKKNKKKKMNPFFPGTFLEETDHRCSMLSVVCEALPLSQYNVWENE